MFLHFGCLADSGSASLGAKLGSARLGSHHPMWMKRIGFLSPLPYQVELSRSRERQPREAHVHGRPTMTAPSHDVVTQLVTQPRPDPAELLTKPEDSEPPGSSPDIRAYESRGR